MDADYLPACSAGRFGCPVSHVCGIRGWGAAPGDVLVDVVCFEAALCQRGGVLGAMYQSLLGPTSQGNKQEGW